eukprot:1160624-Pelagomonas_calceolata.AAC.5
MACIRTTSKTQSAFNIWGLSSLRQGSSTFNTCPKAPNKRKRSAKLNRTRHINLHWLNLQRLWHQPEVPLRSAAALAQQQIAAPGAGHPAPSRWPCRKDAQVVHNTFHEGALMRLVRLLDNHSARAAKFSRASSTLCGMRSQGKHFCASARPGHQCGIEGSGRTLLLPVPPAAMLLTDLSPSLTTRLIAPALLAGDSWRLVLRFQPAPS